jgi:hypothetical protein
MPPAKPSAASQWTPAAEIRKLGRRIIKSNNGIQVAVIEQDFTHTDLRGIGTLTAG